MKDEDPTKKKVKEEEKEEDSDSGMIRLIYRIEKNRLLYLNYYFNHNINCLSKNNINCLSKSFFHFQNLLTTLVTWILPGTTTF